MDPEMPHIEKEITRRRRRRLFSHSRIPVRMLVPNFFTLLGLCAGLTSIRMSIEGRWDVALAAIVFAAMLDGIDGRVARLLKASSRFGAELDSLADFVNFGVAPAILLFTWGLVDIKSVGWICVMMFALASALRLSRFNVAVDEEKPKWQSNFFTGMPTPAAAIVVLLPFYLAKLGLDANESRIAMSVVLVYTVLIAIMMVSTIPTYSGKLLGERIRREYVLRYSFSQSASSPACSRFPTNVGHRVSRLSRLHSAELAPLRRQGTRGSDRGHAAIGNRARLATRPNRDASWTSGPQNRSVSETGRHNANRSAIYSRREDPDAAPFRRRARLLL